MNYLRRLILISLFLSSILWARELNSDFLDSLDRLPPNLRYYYLSKDRKDLLDLSLPDSQNVRMVGKWGRGPSSRVTGRDNLVFLSLGSEVAIVDFSDSNLQIIYEVQARGLVAKSALKDSFLFIGGPGIEIWNISNPSSPVFRNRIITNVSDLCIKDTFLYAIAGDSFRIFNIADISNPYRVGASNDVGYYLSVSGNYAYVSDRWGLYILNIQNPANPYRVNSWGSALLSAQTRDTFCYVSTYDPMNPDWLRFTILNVANPNSIQEVSHIDYAGGNDVYLLSYFAYVSGYYLPVGEFQIIDVSNPSLPSVVSRCTTAGWNNGVWVNNPFGKAFVADDYKGLQIINISDPTNPSIDTAILSADNALDVWVDRNYAYIANMRSGLKIVDITNPAIPFQVGDYDTHGDDYYDIYSTVAQDSFAYIGAYIPFTSFGTIDVSDPSQPVLVGTASMFNRAEDMAIRDTFVYVAEDNKFQIYNVSDSRQPRLVGSCNLPTGSADLCIQDTFAYVTPDLHIVNISNPSNPILVSRTPCNAWGIDVRDTFAFISHAYESLLVYSVANPLAPYEIGWAPLHGQGYDVVLRDNFAFVGCYDFRVFDITDPTHPQLVGYYTTPDRVRRVFADSEYVYAACFSAGVCIFEYVSPGIEENLIERRGVSDFSIIPNPVGPRCYLNLNGIANGPISIKIYNITGQKLKEFIFEIPDQINKYKQEISLKGLPNGVLFFYLKQGTKDRLIKVTKVTRR
jgi:hypothetical protein